MADKPAPICFTVSETMLSFVNQLRTSVTLHCLLKNIFGIGLLFSDLFVVPFGLSEEGIASY